LPNLTICSKGKVTSNNAIHYRRVMWQLLLQQYDAGCLDTSVRRSCEIQQKERFVNGTISNLFLTSDSNRRFPALLREFINSTRWRKTHVKLSWRVDFCGLASNASTILNPFLHFPTVDDCNATLNSPIVICCCIFNAILTNDIKYSVYITIVVLPIQWLR
ncbi:hypothetical protein L9F63_000700, partial [Diploptera punctata]